MVETCRLAGRWYKKLTLLIERRTKMNEKIKEALKVLALEAEAISFSVINAKTTKSREECFSRIQALKGDIVRLYESIN